MQDSWPTLVADEANRFKPFPLTPIQEAYWIGRTAAFELGRTGIHIYEELECDNLDCHRLRHAWQRVLDTHDALRTIVQEDGQQRALPSASYEVEWVDLRSHESRIQEQYLQQLRDTLSHKVYRPESWPLFDIVYVELSSGHGVLFISIDALHVDMSGFRHVFADWVECYRDPDWNFGHPGLRYRDYALALKALENSDVYRASWEFWCREASLLPPAPDLPYKKSFASVERQRFGRCQVRLPSDSWNSLKRRASSAGLTPTAALLTAYAEVLTLWSASEEFTINVTAFNALPLHEDVTDLVGDFTSLVLLAVSLEPDLTFEDRARDLQRRLSERLLHRAVSGVHVLSEFARQNAIEAGRAAMPVVFTSTLNPQTRGLTSLGALGRRRYSIIQTPQVALDLQVSEDAGDLIVHWDYVEELISEPLAREMSGAFETLLAGLSAGVAWRERVPVRIPPAQRKRRQQVNLTEKPFPAGALADLMWPENRRIANEPAVVAGSRSIAYRDLYALASRLAQGLRAAGLRREDRVAVLLPKGVEQIIAVHAIVMAGGAYVPVDLLWPEQRQKHVAELAQFRFAVTNRDHKDAVAAMAFLRSSRLVCVDEEFPPPMAEHEPAGPDSLAYVLFTSGSTGIPKGVQIEHRSVVNRIFDVAGRFSLTSRDRLFGVTALHHDLSVFDLFGAAMTGATLVLPDAGRLRDPDHWARLLSDERVTVWNSVPAFFEMLLEYLERPEARERLPKSLRLILLSGDWIPVDLPWRLGALLPDAQLVALGGPTETTVWDICNPGAEIAPAGRSILYGRPMANAKYYVLDRNLREKPDWTPGELCIGGAGLSRGFLGDAQLTSTRFVAHPVTGERLYRSGDAGRFLPDGNIEILGRLDSQIKIAGQRMEAGEIEAVLCGDPAVREARVRVRRTPSGSVRLVANVVPRVMPQANAPDPGEVEAIEFKLRRHGLLDTEGCDFRVPLRPSGKAAGEEQFLSRRSHRHFDSSPVPFARLSGWLSCLRAIGQESSPLPKFLYPSAGKLYPVRLYVSVPADRIEHLPPGTYYFHPVENLLARVSADQFPVAGHVEHNQCLAAAAAFQVFLVGYLPAIEPIYPRSAREYCLLEAGYISQLLMLEAPGHGLGLCPIGELQSEFSRALKLPGGSAFLHALVGGIPATAPAAGCDSGGCQEALIERLRERVRRNLPAHMEPAHILLLPKIPITPNGKVDFGRLDALPLEGPRLEFQTAATPLEESIAAVVGEVLHISPVPVNAAFLQLRCTSLQLVRIQLRLRAAVAPDLALADLFAYPSVRAIAEHVSGDRVAESSQTRAVERAAGRAEQYRLRQTQ